MTEHKMRRASCEIYEESLDDGNQNYLADFFKFT
jgi:hypothetical protein